MLAGDLLTVSSPTWADKRVRITKGSRPTLRIARGTGFELPVTQATACTLGGDCLADLYITTSAYRLPGAEAGVGAVFRARPNVTALPAFAYRG